MDEGIQNITETLKTSGLWDDTLLIFTNDNGGQGFSGGNNAPYRGNKDSYWEGGLYHHNEGFVSVKGGFFHRLKANVFAIVGGGGG